MSSPDQAQHPESSGVWLRRQRQSKGWSVPEMRRHLREAAKEAGDTLPGNECLGVMIRRWEKESGGISERYRMHYCRAFKVPFKQFGLAPIAQEPFVDVPPVSRSQVVRETAPPAPAPVPPAGPRDREPPAMIHSSPLPGLSDSDGNHLPTPGGPSLGHQVRLKAYQGREHAQQAERRDIGEASLEHLRSEVTRLSRECLTAGPLPLFFEMSRVHEQFYTALDRKVWPRDDVELYFLLGALSSLMACTADNIGSPSAAEELARAGLAYALAAGHRPLTAQLRLNLASIALWAGHPRRSLGIAQSGFSYLTDGPGAAQLHLMTARAAARLGDTDTTLAHISRAADLRDTGYTDDLLQLGGQFTLTRACFHYLAGSALTDLPGTESEAISHLEQAVQLYAASPETAEDHSQHCAALARIDLATILLSTGDLDAALTTAGPVLTSRPAAASPNSPSGCTASAPSSPHPATELTPTPKPSTSRPSNSAATTSPFSCTKPATSTDRPHPLCPAAAALQAGGSSRPPQRPGEPFLPFAAPPDMKGHPDHGPWSRLGVRRSLDRPVRFLPARECPMIASDQPAPAAAVAGADMLASDAASKAGPQAGRVGMMWEDRAWGMAGTQMRAGG